MTKTFQIMDSRFATDADKSRALDAVERWLAGSGATFEQVAADYEDLGPLWERAESVALTALFEVWDKPEEGAYLCIA